MRGTAARSSIDGRAVVWVAAVTSGSQKNRRPDSDGGLYIRRYAQLFPLPLSFFGTVTVVATVVDQPTRSVTSYTIV